MLVISSLTAVSVENVHATGATLYVGGNGPGNYTTIQAAVDASENGDTVYVYDSFIPYAGNVRVNKSINLIGEDNTVVADAWGGYGFNVLADNVSITRFTILDFCYGIETFFGLNCTITNCYIQHCYFCVAAGRYCTVTGCTIDDYEGIHLGPLYGVYTGPSYGNKIIGNTIHAQEPGVHLASTSDNKIQDNTFVNCQEALIGEGCSFNLIHHNTFNHSGNYAIQLGYTSPSNTISDNTIDGFYMGICLYRASSCTVTRNMLMHSTSDGYALYLSYSNYCIITENTFQNNNLGACLGSSANQIYHNNFFNNTFNANDHSSSGNQWDNGSSGNFWNNWVTYIRVASHLLPYSIPGGNSVDRFPLMVPWKIS